MNASIGKRLARLAGLACLLAASWLPAAAQSAAGPTWPVDAVHIIVPYAPGGATDNVARAFAAEYQKMWGKPVIVENKPGAAGNMGAAYVAKATPNGLTLLVGVSSMAAVSALYKKLNYDPLLDLEPVAGFVTSPSLFVVNADMPVNTLPELIELARQKPGALNYGSTGIGSGGQLAFEYFNSMAGTKLVHVPYQGDAPLVPALLGHQVQAAVLQPPAASPLIKAGKLKALAVTTPQRFSMMPDVPTVAEAGLPGYAYASWVGLFAPAGTPAAVIARINADTQQILKNEEFTSKHLPLWNVDAFPVTPQGFKTQYLGEVEKYKTIVRTAKIPQIE